MGIEVSFNLNDLANVLTDGEMSAFNGVDAGADALDGQEVWYEYLTQNDDRVRPSHEALHGTRWRVDDPDAPTPPIDYGCRCFIRYIAAPGSVEAKILPEADGELSNRSDAFRSWLDDNVKDWSKIAQNVKKLPPDERLSAINEALKTDGQDASEAKDIAFMILGLL